MRTTFSASLHNIQEHPYRRVAANDDNQAVVTRVEQIASVAPLLSEQLRPVISAVRSGVITQAPGEVFCYLLGALHALDVEEDVFFEFFDVLSYLRPNQGAEDLLSLIR